MSGSLPEIERRESGIRGLFTKILLPRASKVEALREVVNPEGFGGILVGIRKVEDPGKWFLPRAGVSAPVTVIADFENKSSATCDVTLTLYDPTRRDRALVASRERPLRGGFGAALAYYPNPRWLEYAALIDPARYEDREAIYIVQPYDPGKIPVVLVHGLISIPQMWFPVIAQIEKDPELRGKFQFWTFAYPTGDPVALSALRLREGLRKVYEVYPRTKSMVIVSYSLGGLVGKMQVQTTGDAVWQGIFKDDSARLEAELPPDSLVKRALVFKGNPRISEDGLHLHAASRNSACYGVARPIRPRYHLCPRNSCAARQPCRGSPSQSRSDKGGASCRTAFGDSLQVAAPLSLVSAAGRRTIPFDHWKSRPGQDSPGKKQRRCRALLELASRRGGLGTHRSRPARDGVPKP